MIIDGELDHLPEAAFNLKGTIEEAIEAGEKMKLLIVDLLSKEIIIYCLLNRVPLN
jgi:hypothetical protein